MLAVTLDRLSKAWALRVPVHDAPSPFWIERNRLLVVWLTLCGLGFVLAHFLPYFLEIERKQALSVAGLIDALMDHVIRLIGPITAWVRWFLITFVLIPMRDAYL